MHAGLPLLKKIGGTKGESKLFHYLMTLRGGGAHDTLSILLQK